METYIWLGLFIVLLVIEGLTLGLTTIWFAGGALVAFIMAMFGLPIPAQIIAFIVVSVILLIVTRPIAKKYINGKKYKTNYDGIIGKVAKVTEKIDNYNATGAASFNGQEWSARAEVDGETYEPGTLVKVQNIDGVKIIVTKYQED